jgi:hypothetical protein
MTKKTKTAKKESLREELILQASKKPIRKLLQFDVFQNVVEDDVMRPDEDGDCLMWGNNYELKNTDALRVMVPSGASASDTLRGLKKVISYLKKNPETISWKWGYLETNNSWQGLVIKEPEIGAAYGDSAELNPIVDALQSLSPSLLDEVIKAAQNTRLNKQASKNELDDFPF